jgi:hypothetical protein
MPNTKMWTTREGEKILVKDMTDLHIINTLRMLERMADRWRMNALADAYFFLGQVHGEMAELALERELEDIEENGIDPNKITPVYDTLVDEAIKRGLDWNENV